MFQDITCVMYTSHVEIANPYIILLKQTLVEFDDIHFLASCKQYVGIKGQILLRYSMEMGDHTIMHMHQHTFVLLSGQDNI